MSYILEALKKSQQERELGHVPTLETPILTSEGEGTRPNLWILLAVGLAALAVVIALYSALRGGAPFDEPVVTLARADGKAAPEAEAPGRGKLGETGTKPSSEQPPPESVPVASALLEPEAAPPSQKPVEAETDASSVALEAPAAATTPAAPSPVRERPAAKEQSSPPAQERTNKVPQDLIADIEAFKRQVREERTGSTHHPPAETKTAPQDLRLPKDVRRRLPKFVMSAHIYDSDPSRRFVLINGLKTREGEESREEITVEQILPDGAVLSFDGHRFFQRRR